MGTVEQIRYKQLHMDFEEKMDAYNKFWKSSSYFFFFFGCSILIFGVILFQVFVFYKRFLFLSTCSALVIIPPAL